MALNEVPVLVNACFAVTCDKCGKTTWKVGSCSLGDVVLSIVHGGGAYILRRRWMVIGQNHFETS
jgi:hypothetical protein